MLISGPIGDACSFVTNKLSHWSERECTRTRGAPSQAQGRDGRHGQPISVLGHLLQPNPAQPQIFGMGLRDWANFQVAGKIELFFSWKPLAHVIYTVCFLFFYWYGWFCLWKCNFFPFLFFSFLQNGGWFLCQACIHKSYPLTPLTHVPRPPLSPAVPLMLSMLPNWTSYAQLPRSRRYIDPIQFALFKAVPEGILGGLLSKELRRPKKWVDWRLVFEIGWSEGQFVWVPVPLN